MSIFYTDSGSIQQLVVSSSLFVSGSTTITGSLNLTGNITTPGTITAQTLVVQTITSSISNITGSTQFGSLLNNTHQFTGSIFITGSSFNFNNGVGNYILSNYELKTPSSFLINSQAGYLKLYNTYGGIFLSANPNGFIGFGKGFTSSTEISASLHVTSSNETKAFVISTPSNQNLFVISGSGNVGINNSVPIANLEVAGLGSNNGTFRLTRGDSNSNYLEISGGTYGAIYNHNTSQVLAHIFKLADTEVMRISVNQPPYSYGTGVGIGTRSPQSKLHVSGATGNGIRLDGVSSVGLIIQSGDLAGGTGTVQLYAGNNNNSYLRLASEYIREGSNGGLGIGVAREDIISKFQVVGPGTTSSTTSFLIQNANLSRSIQILDNGRITLSSISTDVVDPNNTIIVSSSIHMHNGTLFIPYGTPNYGTVGGGIVFKSSQNQYTTQSAFLGLYYSDGLKLGLSSGNNVQNNFLIHNIAYINDDPSKANSNDPTVTIYSRNHISSSEWISIRHTSTYLGGSIDSGFGGIVFNTSGSNRLYIQDNGNVGFGTTNPESALDVSSLTGAIFRRADNSAQYIKLISTAGGNFLLFEPANNKQAIISVNNAITDSVGSDLILSAGSTIQGTSVSNVKGGTLFLRAGLSTGNNTTASIEFQGGIPLASGSVLQSYTTHMIINGLGNIAIGHVQPAYKLDISGNVFMRNSVYVNTRLQGLSAGLAYSNLILNDLGGNVGIGTNAPLYPLDISGITRIGNVSASAQLYLKGGTDLGQYIYLDNGGGNIWTMVGGTTSFALRLNNLPRLFINGINGNLGIKNDAPQHTLDVSGSGRFTSNLTVSGSTNLGNTISSNHIVTGSIYLTGSMYVNNKKQFNKGQYYSTEIQPSIGSNAQNSIRLGSASFEEGMSSDYNGKINIVNSGYYNVQFSAQYHLTTTGEATIYTWFRKNGQNLDNSNTMISIEKTSGGGKVVAAWNYALYVDDGDDIDIQWSSANADVELYYEDASGAPVKPAVPSVIITVTQIM